MNRTRIASALVAGLAAAVLTACGPGTSDTAAPRISTTTPAATTTTDTPPSPSPTPPTTTPPTTPPATPTTTAPPTTAPPAPKPTHTKAPAPAVHHTTTPAPHHTTAKPKPKPKPAPKTCSIKSAAGNCYKAGQFCRNADLGKTTTDANGRSITCRMKSGKPHWGY
ncbi:hypothetical protein [Actinacidiphila epipremni]|uniref:Uncharacterized protein n=1 Tax=Actinacidiphila epipremni TaxID=2053013 RepID=A0ABX0ZXG9_9ACTN|nr:hypothetical protein [Actinacidiphila epipremni]NJP46118.1 hypothetical protein [Actinacidiphila epipremni]